MRWNSRNNPFRWYIIWKDTLRNHFSHWRRTEKNWEITWSITQSLGWRTYSHHCPNLLWSSISDHVPQWLHEFPNKTCFTCSQTWHVISYATSIWTHHLLKKNYKTLESPHQCFFKAVDSEISKNQEYSNLFHTYCDAYHARDIFDRRSVISTFISSMVPSCTGVPRKI